MTTQITQIEARQILDSRGNPTIEAKVVLSTGQTAVAAIPSGESVGKYEALELRDGDPEKFGGKGVLKAVANVNEIIAPKIIGFDPTEQAKIDLLLTEMDSTPNKTNLGANALLAVSQGVCEAAALAENMPLYRYVARLYGLKEIRLPCPLFNVINGGRHGAGNLDFQEFHIIPFREKSFADSLETGEEVYQQVRKVLISHNAIHSVGDEGGFAPNLFTNLDALEVLSTAVKESGRLVGKDIVFGLDIAADSFYRQGNYVIKDKTMPISPEDLTEYYRELDQEYPLFLLEDPLHEDDWEHWSQLTRDMKNVLIVGDDLLATNLGRVKTAIAKQACNTILVKPNQAGTISEVIAVINLARSAGWKTVVSHRSGETNDDFIADFAVGTGADFVKFGAPARGERVVKYNRLLAIESELLKG